MSINIDLSNKNALVTGISNGIGWGANLNYEDIPKHPYNLLFAALPYWSGKAADGDEVVHVLV